MYKYRVSKKHGNSVANSLSSLLWISIVIPNFKSHKIIMSAIVYFMKRVKDCKDMSIMSPQDEQWKGTSLLYLYSTIGKLGRSTGMFLVWFLDSKLSGFIAKIVIYGQLRVNGRRNYGLLITLGNAVFPS